MTKQTEAQDHEARIAALESQIQWLQAAVFPRPATPPPPQSDKRQVRIESAPIPPPAHMPNDDELAQLLAMVRERYATFRPRHPTEQGEREYLEQFKAAFRFVIGVGRTAEPNKTFSYDMLCSKCLTHLRQVSAAPPAMAYGPLMAAAIAAGDCPFDDPISAPFPYCYLGINPDLQRSYAGTYKQILSGERDFLKPVFKGRPQPDYRGGVEIDIPTQLRRQGLL